MEGERREETGQPIGVARRGREGRWRECEGENVGEVGHTFRGASQRRAGTEEGRRSGGGQSEEEDGEGKEGRGVMG